MYCETCGTPLLYIDEACPHCLAGSGLCDRPPLTGQKIPPPTYPDRDADRAQRVKGIVSALREEARIQRIRATQTGVAQSSHTILADALTRIADNLDRGFGN